MSRGRIKRAVSCWSWLKRGSRKMNIVIGHEDARTTVPQSPNAVLAWIWEINSAAVDVSDDLGYVGLKRF